MSGLDDARPSPSCAPRPTFCAPRTSAPRDRRDRWCLGGKTHPWPRRTTASGVVMYYGAPPRRARRSAVQAAVLGNFGAEDKGPSPQQVRAFEKALKRAGKRVDFKIYPGAGHAFANEDNPWGGYREVAAKDAWKRTVAFFKRELKQASIPRGRSSK